jgi:hypothetical protein
MLIVRSCDIAVSRDGMMCGLTYNTQSELRKHLRNKHPGASKLTTSLCYTVVEGE